MSRLKKAISLAKSGQSDRAAEMLRELVQENSEDIFAWLWLAECTTDTGEARYAAKQVLLLRPTNSRAMLILDELSGDDGSPFIPVWLRPKRKRDEEENIPRLSTRGKIVLFGSILIGLVALVLGFAYLTDFPNETVSEASVAKSEDIQAAEMESAQETVSIESGEAGVTSDDDDESETVLEPIPVPVRTDDDDALDPESLTIQWIQAVIRGEADADVSFSCDDDSRSGLQRTLEPFFERLVEYGVQTALRTLQLEAVFDVIEVIDAGAEYEVDGKLIFEIFGQRIESPEFSTIIRFISDQGKWVVCEVTGS